MSRKTHKRVTHKRKTHKRHTRKRGGKRVTLHCEMKNNNNTNTHMLKLSEKALKKAEKEAEKASRKGIVPPQLKKPRAWVEYTLENAIERGWEPYTILQKKKNHTTGEIIEEETEMPGSILHNGKYVYEGSVTNRNPSGKQIVHKEAMSLSQKRKKEGHPTYAEFESQYVDNE